jgi:hypothetical protein
MPATVNSRFLSIGTPEPDIRAGWTIRVLDYKNMTSLVAVINEYTAFTFTQELNGTGQGSITMDQDSPFWTRSLGNGDPAVTLQNREYIFEAWDNDTPRFAWLAQAVTNTIVGEDETRLVTISGPGIAQVLTWATINRPGWPTTPPIVEYFTSNADPTVKTPVRRSTSPDDTQPAYLWQFPPSWPTMRMWYTTLRAAQRRGLINIVNPMFTATKDSAKQKWKVVKTIATIASGEGYQPETPSAHLLDFLNDCTGQDYSKWFGERLEWLMYPGFNLDVRTRIGVDRPHVRFFSGGIVSDERARDRENIYNRIIAVDVDGNETIVTDKDSIAAWNLREQRNETNKNVTLTDLRAELANRYLGQYKDEKDEWTIKIPYEEPNRTPYRHFFVGDTVGFDVGLSGDIPDNRNGPQKMRVMAITISVSADSAVPDCELTLKSLIDSRLESIEKQITKLLNNPRNVSLDDIKDISIPEKPDTKSALVYNPATKKWEAVPLSSIGGSGGSGVTYMQSQDPATQANNTVKPGDFWLETYD